MEDEEQTARRMSQIKLEASANGAPPDTDRSTSIPTSDRRDMGSQSPATSLDGMKSRSDSGETPHSVRPTLSRKASRKPVARDAPLYADLPNMTSESCESFQVIPDCLYGSKHMGSTDNDSFDCDCSPEWREPSPSRFLAHPDSDRKWRESRVRRGLRLYQQGDQNGMQCYHGKLQRRLPKSTLSDEAVRERICDQDREERLRASHGYESWI